MRLGVRKDALPIDGVAGSRAASGLVRPSRHRPGRVPSGGQGPAVLIPRAARRAEVCGRRIRRPRPGGGT